MNDSPFETATERILFSQAADAIEQGKPETIPADKVHAYLDKGLLVRQGSTLQLTDKGLEQHRIAKQERFSDG